jgi:hypothetical protein
MEAIVSQKGPSMSNVAIVTANPEERTYPWYGVNTSKVRGLQSVESIQERFPQVFYPVELRPVFLGETQAFLDEDDDGNPFLNERNRPTDQECAKRFATTRVFPDGTLVPYEIVRDRYAVAQDLDVLQRALNLIAASPTDAIFDSVVSFKDGAEVLFVIDLGSLIIDPRGANDHIERFLIVRNSHNGTAPITFLNTSIRVSCTNMLPGLERSAKAVVKARHTLNHEATLQEAEKVLRINSEWAQEFKKMADIMLGIPMTPGRFDTVIDAVWPESLADTERKKANRDDIVGMVKLTYKNNRNAGAVGENGWAAFNAIVEFLDFSRNPTESHRQNLLNHDSQTNARKRQARRAVLALN